MRAVDQVADPVLDQQVGVADVQVVPPQVKILQSAGDQGLLQDLLYLQHTAL